MTTFEDRLSDLARGVQGANIKELAQRRAALEADLETMVRVALRDGTGAPGLLNWVRGALPKLTGTSFGPAAERAAPALARLLCRALVNQYREPQSAVAQGERPTVVGR